MKLKAAIVGISLIGSMAPAWAGAAEGKPLFASKCAACHGANGEGKDAIAKMMKVTMKHLGSKEVQAKSDADLKKVITDGTGNANYFGPAFSGYVPYPGKHGHMDQFWQRPSRPCAGTGILSSRHFPDEFQGNFLNCNVIGMRGIFRVKVTEDGSGLKGQTIEDLVRSDDQNFRPTAVGVAPDGTAEAWDYLFFSTSANKYGRITARMVAGGEFKVRETGKGPREAIPADFADSDKVIAQVGDQRSPLYPDIPLLSENINPALAADFWMGMAAPTGTPQPIVERLNHEINDIINTPAIKAKGDAVSMYPQRRSPKDFGDKLAREWKMWGDVIRDKKLVVR